MSGRGLLLQTWRGLCGMVCVWTRPIATDVAWRGVWHGLCLDVDAAYCYVCGVVCV